jgi:hypothetical protein
LPCSSSSQAARWSAWVSTPITRPARSVSRGMTGRSFRVQEASMYRRLVASGQEPARGLPFGAPPGLGLVRGIQVVALLE